MGFWCLHLPHLHLLYLHSLHSRKTEHPFQRTQILFVRLIRKLVFLFRFVRIRDLALVQAHCAEFKSSEASFHITVPRYAIFVKLNAVPFTSCCGTMKETRMKPYRELPECRSQRQCFMMASQLYLYVHTQELPSVMTPTARVRGQVCYRPRSFARIA